MELDWKGDLERGGRRPSTEDTFEAHEQSHDRAPSATTLRIARRFDALPQRIFDAWVDPRLAGRWLFATASRPIVQIEIDARVNGAFRFVDRHGGDAAHYAGRYLEIVPSRRLVFSLVLPFAPRPVTRVSVDIVSAGRGSRLTLVHEDVPVELASDVGGRWAGMLYGLCVMLESDVSVSVNSAGAGGEFGP